MTGLFSDSFVVSGCTTPMVGRMRRWSRSGLMLTQNGSATPGRWTRKSIPFSMSAKRHGVHQIAKSQRAAAGIADLHKRVAGLQVGPPRRLARINGRDSASQIFHTQGVRHGGHQEGEDHVHDHAGRNDRHPLRHALWPCSCADRAFVSRRGRGRSAAGARPPPWSVVALALPRRAGRIVVLAEHLDVAAQRQDADAVFGFAPLELGQLQAVDVEAQVELLAFDAAPFGHGESGPARGRK